MLIFYVYFLLTAIVPIQFATASTPDDFWREYQTAKQAKAIKNLVEHVQTLSTRQDSDTPTRLEHKKSAVLWFMATGGKNGFRKRPSTPAEKKVMENALIFATLVHESKHSDDLLSIMGIRREAGIETENDRIKKHLVKAQGIITATRVMFHSSSSDKSYIQELFNKEYMPVVLNAKYPVSISKVQWDGEARDFSNIFILDFDQGTKKAFRDIGLRFKSPSYFGFKDPAIETEASAFRSLVLRNCTPDPEIYPMEEIPASRRASQPMAAKPAATKPASHRALRIVTENGSIVERETDGSVTIRPTRDVQIGFLSLRAGGSFKNSASATMRAGSFQLYPGQTEEEFLSVINLFSAIVEKTYI